MPVAATQYFNVDFAAYIWIANINGGFSHISGYDEFNAGKGRMTIKLASLFTLADEQNEKIDQGSLLRYLAEIQWFPFAALSDQIEWQQIDNSTAIATIHCGNITASGKFTFDDNGNITCFEADRYMSTNGKYSLEKWVVPVTEYREFEHIRVPSKGQTIWKLKNGDFSWFNWEIQDINYNPAKIY